MRDFPKRGEIYLVNFDRTVGSEIRKTRPAMIIQNNIANRHSSVTIVAAITSQKGDRLYPTEVPLSSKGSGLPKDSIVLLNQIRTVDKQRLAEKIGSVPRETLRALNRALALSVGLIGL